MNLVRSKSSKAFGPVGNCVNSVHTGLPLACVYSHCGQSSTDIIKSTLAIVNGPSTNRDSIRMPDTMMYGDRGM